MVFEQRPCATSVKDGEPKLACSVDDWRTDYTIGRRQRCAHCALPQETPSFAVTSRHYLDQRPHADIFYPTGCEGASLIYLLASDTSNSFILANLHGFASVEAWHARLRIWSKSLTMLSHGTSRVCCRWPTTWQVHTYPRR